MERLKKPFLAKETDHKAIKEDLKQHLRNADFTLDCLMHMLTDLNSEEPLIQIMDEEDIEPFMKCIAKGFDVRGEESKNRQMEAEKLVRNLLEDVVRNKQPIKQDWSRQHDIWTKCQKARYLLSETDEMDVTWSMVEFHADNFFRTYCKTKLSGWCWITFPMKFYYNSVRLRASYICCITLVLSFSVFAGLLTETFMSTFTPFTKDGKNKLAFHGYLFTLPLMMVLFAFFCEGVVILAFDSAKSVPLINVAATLLQGLRFFTLPRFVIWMIWATTSAVGLQPLSSYLTQKYWISNGDSQLKLSVAKLCMALLFLAIEYMIIKQLRSITWGGLIAEWSKELKINPRWKKFLLSVYCCLTGYFLIWIQQGMAFASFGLGLLCVLIMTQLEPGEKENWVPTLWQRQVVDVSFFWFVEIVPLLSGIWGLYFWGDAPDGRGPLGAFIRSYLWGGVFSVVASTATFQTCNAFIAGITLWMGHAYGQGRDRFRLGAQLEIQKKLESMFHRDRVPPGMLSQIPESIFQLTVKEVEEHSLCFEAYVHELFDQGVPAWKYLWYLSSAILLGVLLRVVQVFEVYGDGHEDQNVKSLKLTRNICIPLSIILCGARWFSFSSSFWSCLKCRCCCFPKSIQQKIQHCTNKCHHWTNMCVKRHLNANKPAFFVSVAWPLVVFGSFIVEKCRILEALFWIPVVCPCFLLLAAFASLAAEKKAPRLVGHLYWKLVWLFAIVITVVLVIPIFRLPPTGASVPIIGNNDTEYKPRPADHQYDLCNWLHGPEPLTALDMATFAGLTYETNDTKIEEKLDTLFSGRAVNMTGSSEYPRYVVFDIGNEKETKTRVIAIKGTSTTQDIYMDITLFSIIKILQGFECIFPVIDLFPLDQIQWFLYRAHLFGQRATEEEFWEKTKKDLETQWATPEWAHRTILTGHSLGGLIAQVMAARLNLSALVFSSPGVKYSAERFGIHDFEYWRNYTDGDQPRGPPAAKFGVQILKSKVRNVIPDRDAVPRVDEHIALVDHIECRDGRHGTTKNTRPWAPYCHMLTRTACELWRACGDVHQREFDCSDYHYGPKDFSEWARPDDNT